MVSCPVINVRKLIQSCDFDCQCGMWVFSDVLCVVLLVLSGLVDPCNVHKIGFFLLG